ncbi:MAG: hypothetical protein ACE5I5_10615 [Candidatus Heimdallarchaeota archaeon]
MSEILMYFNKIKGDYVISCPRQSEGEEPLNICQECPRNQGIVGKPPNKWVRCQPL